MSDLIARKRYSELALEPPASLRHTGCIWRIEALEREIFPEWFSDGTTFLAGYSLASSSLLDFSPGARWQLEDTSLNVISGLA